jgi:hypothetical protein
MGGGSPNTLPMTGPLGRREVHSMLMSKPRETSLQPAAATMALGTFTGRLLVILVIAALAGALWQLSDLLILLFGAILLAIGLCAAARLVMLRCGQRRRQCSKLTPSCPFRRGLPPSAISRLEPIRFERTAESQKLHCRSDARWSVHLLTRQMIKDTYGVSKSLENAGAARQMDYAIERGHEGDLRGRLTGREWWSRRMIHQWSSAMLRRIFSRRPSR